MLAGLAASDLLVIASCFQYAPLHVLATLQEWGPSPYDPLADLLSDWAAPGAGISGGGGDLLDGGGGGGRYDPMASVRAAAQAAEALNVGSKFDPFPSLLSSLSPPPAHGSSISSKYDPLEAALDAAASWQGPARGGPTKYCPVSAVLATEAPSHAAGAAYSSPLAWLLDGWAANSEGQHWVAGRGGGGKWDPMAGLHDFSVSHQHSKWDPAAEVLSGERALLRSIEGQCT